MINLCTGAFSQIKKEIFLHAGSASDSLKKTSHTDEHHHLGVMELNRAVGPRKTAALLVRVCCSTSDTCKQEAAPKKGGKKTNTRDGVTERRCG